MRKPQALQAERIKVESHRAPKRNTPKPLPIPRFPFLFPLRLLSQSPSHTKMAAAIKALNAKIRSNPVSDYFCSTRTLIRNTQLACLCRALQERCEVLRMNTDRKMGQISGAQHRILVYPSQRFWTRRKILKCMSNIPMHFTLPYPYSSLRAQHTSSEPSLTPLPPPIASPANSPQP